MNLQLKEKLNMVDMINRQFNEFKKNAESAIEKLYKNYQSWGVEVSEVTNNSFNFSYWGLTFQIKAEITFNMDENIFKSGQINTYYIEQDVSKLIMTYTFDFNGNIENKHLESDFSPHYYLDFVNAILKLSSQEEFKFQLK